MPSERRAESTELCPGHGPAKSLTRVETVRVGKHGSRVEVSISFLPLRDRRGQVTGVSQVIRDITQQKASSGRSPTRPCTTT